MTKENTRKIVIVGSGPAGYTAAIYAARAGHEPLLIEGLQPGGQLTITTEIENFPGFKDPIAGPELMDTMRAQAKRVGATVISDAVENIDMTSRPIKIKTYSSQFLADAVIISTGAAAKWLNIESEQKFQGRGVSACATCDGFFYRDKKVAVIGGGDTAAEEALYLTNHASEVFLVHRRGELRASKIMADRVAKNKKISVKWHTVVDEILGDDAGVNALRIKDPRNDSTETISLDGVFVAIGHKPNVEFLNEQLDLDENGYVITHAGSTVTSVPGVFAAGDVQDSIFRQAITAAGTGCMAAMEAADYLERTEQ